MNTENIVIKLKTEIEETKKFILERTTLYKEILTEDDIVNLYDLEANDILYDYEDYSNHMFDLGKLKGLEYALNLFEHEKTN